MKRHLVLGVALVATLLLLPSAASAELIWDIVAGGDSAITEGNGAWENGLGNWNTGSGDTTWDNASPQVAQFGHDATNNASVVTVSGTVVATGLTFLEETDLNSGIIQLSGTTATVTVSSAAAADVHSRLETTSGTTLNVVSTGGTTDRFFYTYGDGTGGVNALNGQVVLGDGTNYVTFLARGAGALTGTGAITVNPNARVYLRMDTPTTVNHPFTIAGIGTTTNSEATDNGALYFYGDGDQKNLAGAITLAENAKITFRQTHTISGVLSGDHTLTLFNGNSAGHLYLTNAANSVRRLVVDGGTTTEAYVDINAALTATEAVEVIAGARLSVNAALTTPSLVINGTRVTMLAGASLPSATRISMTSGTVYAPSDTTPFTLGAGQALEGTGTALYQWNFVDGATLEPGEGVGTLTLTSIDLSGGGNMIWQLGTLKDAVDGVAGTDWDEVALASTGTLTLGGTSQLTLDLSAVDGPNSGNSFWTTAHSWLIADVTAATTGGFASIAGGVYPAGVFSTSVVDNDVFLNFAPVPEPGIMVLLAAGVTFLVIRSRH